MDRISFTLNGARYDLSRAQVESRLTDVVPETIHKHAVRVNGTWYPVRQAFEAALGLPRGSFISHTARRHLAALDFEVRGEIVSRVTLDAPVRGAVDSAVDVPDVAKTPMEWHSEANVQAAVVAALAADGWKVRSVANTATKERGIDIVAERDGQTVGVEVKGYPSRDYADPARAGQTKRTAPSTQAGHWFAQAVLAGMRLRGKEPGWRSVIALPDFPRYRTLHSETAGSLAAARIDIWWVAEEGAVSLT